MQSSVCAPVTKIAERLQVGWVGRVSTISDRDDMVLLQRPACVARVLFLADSTSMALHVCQNLGERTLCNSFHSVAAESLPLLAQRVVLVIAQLLPARQPLFVPFVFVSAAHEVRTKQPVRRLISRQISVLQYPRGTYGNLVSSTPQEALKRPKTPEPRPLSKKCEFCCEINSVTCQHIDFTLKKAVCCGLGPGSRCEHVIHTLCDQPSPGLTWHAYQQPPQRTRA